MTEPIVVLRRSETGPSPTEPLWRHVLGRRLRLLRQERAETLTETAGRAGLSPQYLSEVERGVKEPSSEMIAAVAGALEVSLLDLTVAVARDLRGAGVAAGRGTVVELRSTGRPRTTTLAPASRGPSAYLLAA